jgi:hypothetical protein
MRFTSRDPAKGSRQELLTLHKYLYTGNGPVNRTDLTGKAALNIAKTVISGYEAHALAIGIAAYAVATNSDVLFDIAIKIDSNLIKVMALSALGFSTNAAVVAVTMPDFWDPTKSPGDDWVWRGKGEVGSPDGAWYNPDIDESLHPDLDHPGPVGPHWDHVDKDGKKWRIKPDGTAEPK